ncbi:hypothetical protein HPB50_017928 [Hyalomma asiaticum]|uniref:Uncharacterized protein n=1 Tax=Hyalomma asiaticum TaxID=266040 RepID=A0ACB7T7P1_HYAAI|nr:hypothetical protein HPB50_017928 [Hyalomma asiaticum]
MPERKGAGERRGLVIKKRIVKASRMPPMPEEHIKIVIRPRGGLNLEKVSPTTVGNAVVDAAGFSSEQTKEDIICPNFKQNILVASTPERSNAEPGGGGGAAGGHTTWADKAKGFTTTGRAREQRQEHVSSNKDKDRIAQLDRENHSLKAAIEGLTKEIAELRSALPSGNSDSLRQGSKHDDPVEVPRSVEVAEENMADEETPAPKKRALSSKVRAQGKDARGVQDALLVESTYVTTLPPQSAVEPSLALRAPVASCDLTSPGATPPGECSVRCASRLRTENQPEMPQCLHAQDVPEPFRRLALQHRHPSEPPAEYTVEKPRRLCTLSGVWEINRRTHLDNLRTDRVIEDRVYTSARPIIVPQ